MKERLMVALLAVLAGTAFATSVATWEERYREETGRWREQRLARLQAADGWLSLIGLHFLREGPNRIGTAKDNDVVLAAGPAHFGTAMLTAEGGVSIMLAEGIGATVDGTPVRSAELKPAVGTAKPTLVAAGSVSFFVIERGGKKALRVKDSEAERRKHFVGLDYFPIDSAWRIEARWEPFEKSRQIPITNILGQTAPALVPGRAVFERDGKTYELLPIDEGPGEPLFFVFSDATSGKETYGAARFLYAVPQDGKIVLDFNRAQNPPCAFTPFATCPLPPKENRLPFAVTAGEKNYRGAHE